MIFKNKTWTKSNRNEYDRRKYKEASGYMYSEFDLFKIWIYDKLIILRIIIFLILKDFFLFFIFGISFAPYFLVYVKYYRPKITVTKYKNNKAYGHFRRKIRKRKGKWRRWRKARKWRR